MPALATLLYVLVFVVTWGAGAALLARLFGEDQAEAAVALGPVAGLLLLAFPGWLLSAFLPVPMPFALALGGAAVVSAAALGGRRLAAPLPLRPALLVAGVFLVFLALRSGTPDIRQTEKPMDAAVLAALLVTPRLPLGDPWLAGERFPYYHFGSLVAALPARLAGLRVEYAYNVLAALLPALVAGAAWGAVRLRGGGRRVATAAALAVAFAGTPDGARQLLAGGAVDLWASSRRVAHAITEWPFFTFQLGDLHAHALALPFLVALAGIAGRVRGAAGVALEAALVAALLAANPWDLPAALLLVAAGALVDRPVAAAGRRAAAALAAAVVLTLPLLLAPHPPFAGLRRVIPATTSAEAFLHFGAFVAVPALALGAGLARLRRPNDEALLLAALLPATGIALSLVTLRPVLGLAAAGAAAALLLAFSSEGALRAGFLLLVAPCALVAFPELFAVSDPYGEELQRMNTVFKCWSAAAPLLVVSGALLAALPLATRRARWLSRGAFALALAAAAVHPASLLAARARQHGGTLDGLTWMAPGDRAALGWLRGFAPRDAVIAEAPGLSYGDQGRIGTFSGRPTVLGWSGHEGLWRGDAGAAEIAARRVDLETLFTSRDERAVRDVVARRRIAFVVVGPLEREAFGPAAFPLGARFPRVFSHEGTALRDVRP